MQRIILGSGRSGTTWVLDCLAEANELRPVFEPLHQNESSIGADYAYDVLTPSDSATGLEQYFSDISAGNIHSRWIDFRAPKGLLFPRPRYFSSYDSTMRWVSDWRKYIRRRGVLRTRIKRNGVLIKCIRANLMAGWFVGKLSYQTVLVIRHPCAVVESQLRLGKTWDPSAVRAKYRDNIRLHEITNDRYRELLSADISTVEALTLNWVIENQLPMERAGLDGYSVHFYEDLVGGEERGWARMCRSLDLSTVPAPDVLRKPSQQSDPASTLTRKDFSSPGWRERLSAAQLAEIQGILDLTKFKAYRADSNEPEAMRVNTA